MRDLIDLEPAAAQVATLVARIDDDQLGAATPCPAYTVGDLLDHVLGLTLAFRWAAEKRRPPAQDGGPPAPSAANLGPEWRARLQRQLDDLVDAWRDPAAWTGETEAGGVTQPASEMGVVALDELVLHGWDLARATGQPFEVHPAHVEAVLAFTTAVAEAGAEAREGLFGPPLDGPADETAFHRALRLAGRDPHWTP